jgi:hypothetical protein
MMGREIARYEVKRTSSLMWRKCHAATMRFSLLLRLSHYVDIDNKHDFYHPVLSYLLRSEILCPVSSLQFTSTIFVHCSSMIMPLLRPAVLPVLPRLGPQLPVYHAHRSSTRTVVRFVTSSGKPRKGNKPPASPPSSPLSLAKAVGCENNGCVESSSRVEQSPGVPNKHAPNLVRLKEETEKRRHLRLLAGPIPKTLGKHKETIQRAKSKDEDLHKNKCVDSL